MLNYLNIIYNILQISQLLLILLCLCLYYCVSDIHRHTNASSRPSFEDLVITLTRTEDALVIPSSGLAANPDFLHLGGDLDVGKSTYKELQSTYT